MKKIFLSLTFLFFISSAYAGSCPMMAGKLQTKIDAHKSGNHAKSEELLNKALNMFKG